MGRRTTTVGELFGEQALPSAVPLPIISLCAGFDAWQRAFAVRAIKSARQRPFAV
jgi:hypothetical protein